MDYGVEERRWVYGGEVYEAWPGGGMLEVEREECGGWGGSAGVGVVYDEVTAAVLGGVGEEDEYV